MCVEEKENEGLRYKGIQDVRKEEEESDRGRVRTIRPPIKDCTNLNKGTDPDYGIKATKSTNEQWKMKARLAGKMSCDHDQ